MEPQVLRKTTIDYFNGGKCINETVKKFIDYITAYCAEMKLTEFDILHNDKLFNSVYHLFETVVLQKYQYNEI